MKLFIHTLGRPDKQTTLAQLPDSLKADTILVVQEQEYASYSRRFPEMCVPLPREIKRLSPTRQWIMDYAKEQGMDKIVMMDDDLTFAVRRDDTTKLHKATPEDVKDIFQWLKLQLDDYAHAGISAREGNNTVAEGRKEVGRMMRLLAYDVDAFHKEGIRFDRIDTKQDFDVTLQFLRKGMPNSIGYWAAHNQAGSNVAGGCSTYRDQEMMSRCSNELAELHPGFVKVVQKETKTSWGGGVRTDVVISWKKAYKSSCE